MLPTKTRIRDPNEQELAQPKIKGLSMGKILASLLGGGTNLFTGLSSDLFSMILIFLFFLMLMMGLNETLGRKFNLPMDNIKNFMAEVLKNGFDSIKNMGSALVGNGFGSSKSDKTTNKMSVSQVRL
ncbi:cag pathogenicity island type IV secretion system protein CagQ [Helicobacter pylori]|uniref:cag pathogenicity island type IV secretion system protein CagQ n=1 Tax=Helicobacter pylori TaxID=210 RepID=UPI00112BC0EB|nr:cag pathogenicity island type IV secretion system protein CagQ [Helicobacter pylori]TPH33053.1 cag pathogenicity island type IV secretion system protein CagQ [Helicobacter pylori]